MDNFVKDWLLDPTIGKLVAAAVGILVIVVIVRVLQRSSTRYIKDSDTRYRVRKLVSFFGYLSGIFLFGIIFSDSLGRLTVAFGVAGAGIAFALQEVIASIAGWVAVSLGRFYRIGDRIQLGGITGDVIDVGLLRTTVMECGAWVKADLYNGRIVRVANSFVFKEPVFNYSADFPFLWDEIVLPVRYGSDPVVTRQILKDVADDLVGDYAVQSVTAWKKVASRYMIEEAAVEPTVTMTANENWVEFTLRYIVDYKKRRSIKDQLFSRIFEAFDKTDGSVKVASTSMAIDLVHTPLFDVRLSSKTKGPEFLSKKE
ncbi:MAG TPA: mechanosensitive ion channel [Desulfobacterales bacterium]|nr:mechanosensitive ion channel [Desulfobacterales bacterium]